MAVKPAREFVTVKNESLCALHLISTEPMDSENV